MASNLFPAIKDIFTINIMEPQGLNQIYNATYEQLIKDLEYAADYKAKSEQGLLIESKHLKFIIDKTRKLNNLRIDNNYGEDLGGYMLDRDILIHEIIAECTYLALEVMSTDKAGV